VKIKQEFRKTLEQERAVDVLMETLMDIENQIAVCRYEISQLENDGKKFDPKTGVISDNQDRFYVISARQRWERQLADYLKMKINLQMQVGLVPRDPERIYRSLEEEGKRQTLDSPTAPASNRSRDESINELIEKMSRNRTIS